MTSTTAFRIDGGNHKEGQQQQMQYHGQPQVPYSPSGASHLQSKRPPNIHIGSSNTAEMNGGTTTSTSPAPPTTAQTVMAPKAIQLSANGQHKLEAHARSVTPLFFF
ncbi:Hypothetical protein, putative [Bodo saltans]|uniref:Uncharacterized protein n=1 Tax=Bodo saltans TaxID=75058 RepID=A0A0S4KGP9_BODSA|nr:Hypothetical protein, putative [Bodo saltans]|eukprot:CUI14864.1 Hypothetical protein, putative [Bodo saltans]